MAVEDQINRNQMKQHKEYSFRLLQMERKGRMSRKYNNSGGKKGLAPQKRKDRECEFWGFGIPGVCGENRGWLIDRIGK